MKLLLLSFQMLHATNIAPGRKPRKIHFPGITADARKLKVNRTTLWRALNGDWHLPGLRLRYAKLKEAKLSEGKI